MEILSGQTIKGYELKERLGAGGFGAVYKAHQSTVGREVAIKIILPGFASHPEFIRRFETEAQLVARLEHPYITPLYDYWRDPTGAYLVMRWLRGGNLQQALQSGAFSVPSSLLFMEQITTALATAHRNQIIHRDLKPANILLDEDGNAYLADFGIAKDVSGLQKAVTQPDAMIGSPDYLAPEQARSEAVTPQTDIYSLGVILYEVLTGEHPFPNLPAVERLYKHLNDSLPFIENLPPQITDAVNEVIQKATAKNPMQRYGDALELMTAFRAAVASSSQKTLENVVEILTRREQEILQLIVDGLSNKEISQELFLTLATVKWYVTQIYGKLHVRSRVQAIVRARELNLIVSVDSEERSVVIEGVSRDSAQFQVENPYKGLLAFQSSDHMDFFGREKLIQKVIHRLQTVDEGNRFLAIVGPSGSGKSSLLKAGLIPALWRGDLPGSEKWFVVEMVPGTHPLDELEIALTRVAANQAGNLHEQLARDERGLVRAANLILPHDDSQLVVVIDQFEEVFTLSEDDAARIHFLNLLVHAVTDPRSRVRVIITLRADFYDRPLHYPQLGDLVRTRMETLLPLSAEELERAISKPAERVGLKFEDGLVASIVSEINYQPGALPLLQYALTELFEQRQGRLLTHDAYQSIGRAVGALANRAEQLYTGLPTDQQELTREMFLQLVTVSNTPQVTRRRMWRTELLSLTAEADVMDELIDTFAAYRLLTLDHDAGTRNPTVEVAHEAILREWRRLSNWINEYREDIKMREQLDHIAQEWEEKGKEVSYLVGGQRLKQFEGWADAKRQALTAMERAYLEASLAERTQQAETETKRQQREKKLERRSVTFLRGLVVVMALALFGTTGLTGIATNQSNIAQNESKRAIAAQLQAQDQGRIATARELTAYANAKLNADAELSTLLAMQAVKTTYDADKTVLPEANTVLHQAVQGLNTPLRLEAGLYQPGASPFLAYSPDGKRIAYPLKYTADFLNELTAIADVTSGQVLYRVDGEPVEYSILNDHLITMNGIDKGGRKVYVVYEWDISSPPSTKLVKSIELALSSDFNYYEASPDMKYLGEHSPSAGTRIWDLTQSKPAPIANLPDTLKATGDFVFSPDGTRFVYLDKGGKFTVLDPSTWKPIVSLSPSGTTVIHAVSGSMLFMFSGDSRRLITYNANNTISLWDMASRNEEIVFTPSFTPNFINISPDGNYVGAGAASGELTVWETSTGEQKLNFAASPHQSFIFSPDNTHLATLNSGELKIWNLVQNQEYLTMNNEPDPNNGPLGLAYSPDGRHLVVASVSATPNVWDAQTGKKSFELSGHTARVLAVAWSPDGKQIATGGEDTDIILWDAMTGKQVAKLSGHLDKIYGLAYSPDGTQLASSSFDQTVRVWDLGSQKTLLTLNQPAQSKGVAWSPDGKRIAASTDIADDSNGHVQVWDAQTGTMQLDLLLGDTRTGMVTFSPDGARILIGTQESHVAYVFDAKSGDKLFTLSGHISNVPGVAYSPDGTLMASSGLNDDGTIRLRNSATGDDVLTLYSPAGVGRITFSPDGKHLATQNYDGTTRIYVLDIDELLALAQSRLTRWWTVDECKKYLHTDTCPTKPS